MKTCFLLVLVLGMETECFAQQAPLMPTLRFVDTMPTMMDGSEFDKAVVALLRRSVNKNKLGSELRSQEKVYFNLAVDSTGVVGQGEGVLRNGSQWKPIQDAEIKRAVDALPRVSPARKNGQKVNARFMLRLY